MKVLYGVQGTGNGHITRARGMVKHLAEFGLDTDFIFTGRPLDKFNDMEPFGQWQRREGMTFEVKQGKVKTFDTALNLKPRQFWHDINELDLSPYDLILTDFEPVTAWAAKRQKKPCFGLGHQYAFDYAIPKTGDNPFTRMVMRQFAPTTYNIGMHWYHFGQPILPPIVDVADDVITIDEKVIVVYLPFESVDDVLNLLRPLSDYQFLFYGHFTEQTIENHITMNPISREGFQKDLLRCNGVISNAGFELASEAIALGKKILAKPLHGQMEQLSNALALEQLGLGQPIKQLDVEATRRWLSEFEAKQVEYPNVAKALCEWISQGELENIQPLIESLWAQTKAHGVDAFNEYPTTTLRSRASAGGF
ncbi:glycosyltransferase family protein [Aurantivibrio plasticivorans]